MADELKITPDGSTPDTNPQMPETEIPGLIGAASEAEGMPEKIDLSAGISPAVDPPTVDLPSIESESAYAVSSNTASNDSEKSAGLESENTATGEKTSVESESSAELSTESSEVTPSEPAEKTSAEPAKETPLQETEPAAESQAATPLPAPKKKLPKSVLVGGALAFAMLVGAGAYYGLGGFFKGELAAPDTLSPSASTGTVSTSEEVCPYGTYYNPSQLDSDLLRLTEETATDAIAPLDTSMTRTQTSLDRRVAVKDYGKAQLLTLPTRINDSVTVLTETTSPTLINEVTTTMAEEPLTVDTGTMLDIAGTTATDSDSITGSNDTITTVDVGDINLTDTVGDDFVFTTATNDMTATDVIDAGDIIMEGDITDEDAPVYAESTTVDSPDLQGDSILDYATGDSTTETVIDGTGLLDYEAGDAMTEYTPGNLSDTVIDAGLLNDYTVEEGVTESVVDGSGMTDYTVSDATDEVVVGGTDSMTGIVTELSPDYNLSVESDFDPAMCASIPMDNCDLLEKLKADPSSYFLHADTIAALDGWITDCSAPIITVGTTLPEERPTTVECGTNEILKDGVCVCADGYFDISGAYPSTATAIEADSSDNLRMTDTVTSESNVLSLVTETADPGVICVDCTNIKDIIAKKKLEIETAPIDTNITALKDELTSLERIAEENGCITPAADVTEEVTEEITVVAEKTCGTYQTLVDGVCVCSTDYFDISSATPTTTLASPVAAFETTTMERVTSDAILMTDYVASSTLECVNCDMLADIIAKKKIELENVPIDTDMTALQDELASLERLSVENNCTAILIPIETPAEPIEVTAVSECDQYAENAETLLARGDVRGSYTNAVSYVQNDCGREYTPCEEYLAIARLAREYAEISTTVSPASTAFFEAQYDQYKTSYYSDASCVDVAALCVETERAVAAVDVAPTDDATRITDADVPSVEVLTMERVDAPSTDVLMLDISTGTLSMAEMQREIDMYIDRDGLETDQERADYLAEYCAEDEVPAEEIPVLITREEPVEEPVDRPPVEEPVEEEQPARLIVVETDDGGAVAPASAPPEEESAVIAATTPVEEQPVAGGSVSQPVAGGTVSPAATEPEKESAATTPDNLVASTETTPGTSDSAAGEVAPATSSPPSTTGTAPAEPGELKPAAPSEPVLTPVETPSSPVTITEESAPPDIHPVGPEVIIYALALIASQMYFFRRKILAFVTGR